MPPGSPDDMGGQYTLIIVIVVVEIVIIVITVVPNAMEYCVHRTKCAANGTKITNNA